MSAKRPPALTNTIRDQALAPPAKGAWRRLSGIPVTLALTAVPTALTVYFLLSRGLLSPIALRWTQFGDLRQFATYCLVVVALCSALTWVGARRYVLLIIAGLWTVTIFDVGAVVTVCALALPPAAAMRVCCAWQPPIPSGTIASARSSANRTFCITVLPPSSSRNLLGPALANLREFERTA